jgi:exodeoxyribonuclease-3
LKIVSFNVNGVRAVVKKNFIDDVVTLNPDILCLQETKAMVSQVEEALEPLDGYYIYANEAEKKGYSGTAILSKQKPLSVSYGINSLKHDREGRVICAEYKDYFLVNVYVPNSGSQLLRLEYRQNWDRSFCTYLKDLEKNKPVIVCGDFNVAHKTMDLARPKQNYNRSAGFMQEEIDGMDYFEKNGLKDSFRYLHPNEIKYSWWSYRAGARQKNIGWRIDYFLVSEKLLDGLENAEIHNDVFGSDHCPVSISF